ncbi:hypothetical protein V6669_06365 [Paenibacillus sp. Y5S-9]|uniref:hypothetical protein n=1 Tax=Paenibacillus sp. Y5S-9 TaxID=3122489 RepID=UPI0030D5C1EB
MADTIKYMYEDAVPTTATAVYTVPSGKCAVAKSFVISNPGSVARTFRLIVGGIVVAYDHTIKGYDTIFIDDLDIPLLPGETIIIMGSTATIKAYVTGFERDYVTSEYSYQKINHLLNGSIMTPANTFDAMIKAIVICNPNAVDTQVGVTLKDYLIAPQKVVKANDSLIIPMPKLFLPKGRQITLSASGSNCHVGIILEKVVQ